MKETELKPCPFCGSNSIAVEMDSMFGDKVWCENCNAKFETDALKFPSAITLWNRRADNEQRAD